MRFARPAALAALLAVLPRAGPAEEPRPLPRRLSIDLPVTAAAAALWIGSEVAKKELAPGACRFCGTNALDSAARDLLVWPSPRPARVASDVMVFGLLPAGMVAHQLLAARAAGDAREGWADVLVIGEAAALALDLNQIVKFAVGRERPFVHFGDFDDPARPHDPDDDLSFYSGHATLAFSIAAAAGTVSTLRGYPSAPWVWGVGLSLAACAGYLRIAGDMHYLTDVLTGAVVGAAFGVAVPLLFHRDAAAADGRSGASLVPAAGGIAIVF